MEKDSAFLFTKEKNLRFEDNPRCSIQCVFMLKSPQENRIIQTLFDKLNTNRENIFSGIQTENYRDDSHDCISSFFYSIFRPTDMEDNDFNGITLQPSCNF